MPRPKQVDSRVPRAKAAFHAILPGIAFLIQAPVLVALVGAAMAMSVLFGPKASLFGNLYTRVIRPVFKIEPGSPDEASPHIFAEAVGAVFLILAASLLYAGLNTAVGWGLALAVVTLALLNWLAGICVGCQMYLLVRRFGRRAPA